MPRSVGPWMRSAPSSNNAVQQTLGGLVEIPAQPPWHHPQWVYLSRPRLTWRIQHDNLTAVPRLSPRAGRPRRAHGCRPKRSRTYSRARRSDPGSIWRPVIWPPPSHGQRDPEGSGGSGLPARSRWRRSHAAGVSSRLNVCLIRAIKVEGETT